MSMTVSKGPGRGEVQGIRAQGPQGVVKKCKSTTAAHTPSSSTDTSGTTPAVNCDAVLWAPYRTSFLSFFFFSFCMFREHLFLYRVWVSLDPVTFLSSR